ncbi:potassium-transporting ATPase subunit KdpA [Staphylococcus argenteus]
MVEIILFLVIIVFIAYVFSKYLYRVALIQPTFADGIFRNFENVCFKIIGTDLEHMSAKRYLKHFLAFNALMGLIAFVLLLTQQWLFLNPNHNLNQSFTLALNTAASFLTNTNLQHYSGETGATYLTQMIVMTYLMFTSSASGYAVCIAMLRRLTGLTDIIGNFYQDIIRFIVRVLLPISFLLSNLLMIQGVPQTLHGNLMIRTLSGQIQHIAIGPIASLESIKHLGTNGGGFLGGNASTPFENPNIWSNFIEMGSMMLLPLAILFLFRRMLTKNGRHVHRHVWVLFVTMFIIFISGIILTMWSEYHGNPLFNHLGIHDANFEGKEVRFGIGLSSVFSIITTAFTTGSVNNMHDSLTALGGLGPMIFMMLNIVFGGEGVGLMNLLIYVLLTVFICSLMVGKTPEYLNMPIGGREMKCIVLAFLIHPILILVFSALVYVIPGVSDTITNPSFHGVSQVLYEMTSASANNGSGFEGLKDNTTFWNISTGIIMIFARYVPIILQLMIASSLVRKKSYHQEKYTIAIDKPYFGVSLVVFIILLSGLTFVPVLLLGPIGEFLTLK